MAEEPRMSGYNPWRQRVNGLVAWGDVDTVAARVREHLDVGADHVCVQVLRGDTSVPAREWELLARSLL